MNETTNRDDLVKLKLKIVEIATKILEDKIDLIEGCRNLVTLHYDLDVPNDAFLFLRGVESETDYIPIGRVRDTCAPEYLARVDREKEQYLTSAKNDILNACKQILENLS
jgi:hypothetical protein